MNQDKICIVVQGPTFPQNVDRIKQCWSEYPIIFSTWVDSDSSCYDKNDIVIYNEYPDSSGFGNWNYQKKSTLEGIRMAKKLGYGRVLKWRSDFLVREQKNLINLFEKDKLNFWAFITMDGGYLTDFFIEGDSEIMMQIFNTIADGEFPEKILTNRIYELQLQNNIKLIVDLLGKETDVFWIKHNYWFSQNIGSPIYSSEFGKVLQ